MKNNIPHSSFRRYTPKIACMIESWMIAKLFWPKKLIAINDKGELNFSHQGISYSYQLLEPKLFFTHKNTRVIIHYSVGDTGIAHIFTEVGKNYIGEVNLRPVWTKDKPEILHKHVGSINKIHAFVKKQRMLNRIEAGTMNYTDSQSKLDNLSKRLNKKIAQSLIQISNGKETESNYQY